MAVDMFMKIEPAVKGESSDDKHKGEIDVLSWSWGVSNNGSFHTGTGGGSGKCNVNDITFTKYVDLSTHLLLQKCASGKHFDKATLVVRKAGDKPLEYLTITMDKVMVTAVQTGGSGGEDRLTENVTLNFAKFKLVYKGQDDKGNPTADQTATWDIAANKE
jgi:type VI secretion system secreted protein Hcp